MKKRAQFNLSAGMIFSIILIIAFVAFAFYIIPKFLDLQRTSQVGMFLEDLQEDIDKMWQGAQGSQQVTYNLPSKIEKVCFNDESEVFFEPFGSSDNDLNYQEVKHFDFEATTDVENPFCIENTNGKIKMVIKKDFGDTLVRVENVE